LFFFLVPGCVSPGFITTLPEEVAAPSLPAPITVHFIDVGQGDAIFIDTNGQDVLIDSGIKSAGSRVAQYIAAVSDPTVKILMASNHDADHMGGLIKRRSLHLPATRLRFCGLINMEPLR
jgi:beta-lactamase superfamily II metal-dependent hydrolase